MTWSEFELFMYPNEEKKSRELKKLPAELNALCLSQIARFKRPKDYVFVDALPKNNYGKILKTDLRAQDAARVKDSARAKRQP